MWGLVRRLRQFPTLTVRRNATTATTGITRMIARPTATTVLGGSAAVCSWALARGTVADGAMDVAGAMVAADGVTVAAATVTDALDTADGLDTVMAVALDMVRGPDTAVEHGLVTVAVHGLVDSAVEDGLLVVDSTAVVAEASMAVAVDMAAADTGNFLA